MTAERTPRQMDIARYNLIRSKAALAGLLAKNFTSEALFVTVDFTGKRVAVQRKWARQQDVAGFLRKLNALTAKAGRKCAYVYALDWDKTHTARIVLNRDAIGTETAAEAGAQLSQMWDCGDVRVEPVDLSSGWDAVAERLGAWEHQTPKARAWISCKGLPRPGERGDP